MRAPYRSAAARNGDDSPRRTLRAMTDAAASELSPAQSGLRFLLEIAALGCWAIIGWQITDGGARWVLTIVLPLVAAAVWATFRVPGDRSAKGNAPVPVPGLVRLFVEIDVLLGAAVIVAVVGRPLLGIVLATAVIFHIAATHRRIGWLLARRTVAD